MTGTARHPERPATGAYRPTATQRPCKNPAPAQPPTVAGSTPRRAGAKPR